LPATPHSVRDCAAPGVPFAGAKTRSGRPDTPSLCEGDIFYQWR
jgi:hypothetical protein